MVPSDILQRTFRLQFGSGTATCFALDIDGKQYLITARHVVEGILATDRISIMHDKQWKEVECNLIGMGQGPVDIAVLSITQLLFQGPSLSVGESNTVFLSEDVWFLGFPYGLQQDIPTPVNGGFPIPYVKKAIISAFDIGTTSYTDFLLDGHNNPGFSGGPVVAQNREGPGVRVIGVISGYKSVAMPVLHLDQATPFQVQYNTGIIDTYSIIHAIDIIKLNPSGYTISQKNT